jgi:unsaturated rhamnogalacturonyl hydrolase
MTGPPRPAWSTDMSQSLSHLRSTTLGAVASVLLAVAAASAQAPAPQVNDSNTPLHLLRPAYPVPYGPTTPEKVTEVLTRIHGYLETNTPATFVNRGTGKPVADPAHLDDASVFEPAAFRPISYEWGVTYTGMMLASQVTGDARFKDYVAKRLALVAAAAPGERVRLAANPQARTPLRSVLEPRALDDAGSMCAAMIKAQRAGIAGDLRPMIDHYIEYILTKEYRLKDGTLARNRPQPDTLWLDDVYMSLPALAQMGVLTGERKYFDEAARQFQLFSQRLFDKDKGLFLHGWVQGMEVHPEFHWARANGWGLMTMVELLDALPADHPGRQPILETLRAHVRGLASRQSGSGFWHQLLDREDSYLETSATAIYAYAMARAINRGWIDPMAYGPAVLLAWNAVTTKVNAQGQVEGTCVGTGMGFEPAFYYHRPVSPFAAHGYGPVLLAGAEMLTLMKTHRLEINDSAVMLYR